MKRIQLGGHKYGSPIQGYSLVDDADYEWLNQWKWFCGSDGYAKRNIPIKDDPNIRQKSISMHRIILEAKDGEVCDHKNNNRLDNRRENLRICTPKENSHNRSIQKNNQYGFRGVGKILSKRGNAKWIARIRVNRKLIHIGTFPSISLAAHAYDEIAKKYNFSKTNF